MCYSGRCKNEQYFGDCMLKECDNVDKPPLCEVRAFISGMRRIDTADIGVTEKRRIEKARIEGYNQAINDVLQKISEHF